MFSCKQVIHAKLSCSETEVSKHSGRPRSAPSTSLLMTQKPPTGRKTTTAAQPESISTSHGFILKSTKPEHSFPPFRSASWNCSLESHQRRHSSLTCTNRARLYLLDGVHVAGSSVEAIKRCPLNVVGLDGAGWSAGGETTMSGMLFMLFLLMSGALLPIFLLTPEAETLTSIGLFADFSCSDLLSIFMSNTDMSSSVISSSSLSTGAFAFAFGLGVMSDSSDAVSACFRSCAMFIGGNFKLSLRSAD
mmetsp:Transcript_47603/g.84322  ORF Transcript_47603/g.84322 Transcript_47603/m.84322 type:complete len:248 (+) Transcript_47603:101-844(+)